MSSSTLENRLSSLSNSLKYFDELTQLSDSLSQNTTLKSFYLYKHASLETKLAAKPLKQLIKCCHCSFNFAEKLSQHYVKPGVRNRRFNDRILKKHERGDILTTYQRLHLKKINKSANNKMIIVCAFCNYNNSVLLPKPKHFKPSQTDSQESKESLTLFKDNAETSKKRKKRRKDKFCGLNSSVVLSAIAETEAEDLVVFRRQEDTPVKENISRQDKETNNKTLSTNKNKKQNKSNNTIFNSNLNKRKNSHQLTRNMNDSKMKIAKNKKNLKMKITNMLNTKSETTTALSLQNLIKET